MDSVNDLSGSYVTLRFSDEEVPVCVPLGDLERAIMYALRAGTSVSICADENSFLCIL